VLVRLTDSGRELADAALTSLLKNERELLAALPDRRLGELADLLRELTVQFESE
jgi:DNA-binding MarR family transcriptional regulator